MLGLTRIAGAPPQAVASSRCFEPEGPAPHSGPGCPFLGSEPDEQASHLYLRWANFPLSQTATLLICSQPRSEALDPLLR